MHDQNITAQQIALLLTHLNPEGVKKLIHEGISEALGKINQQRPQELRFLSQQGLARELGLSVPTIIQMRKAGKIHGVQIGNKWRYELNEVWADLRNKEEKGAAA